MGLRHRSIRLRVGILIAVPVLCLLALYGFVASITLGSALTQQHVKSLRNELADPVTAFQQQVARERYLALQSLANPTNTQVASALGQQESVTQHALTNLTAALHSPNVTNYAGAQEKTAIANLLAVSSLQNFEAIRGDVSDDSISMRGALGDYDAIVDAGYPVIDAGIDQQASVPLVTQGLDIVDLDQAAQATQAEWDLLAGDMAQRRFPTADRLTFAALANQRQSLISNTVPQLDAQYRAMLTKSVPASTSNAMTAVESAVTGTPWHRGRPPAQLAASKTTFLGYSTALGTALAAAGTALQQHVQHNANTVVLELILAAGLGLLGTIVSIALSLIIGRGLIRQLRELRESALTLAHEKLPSVISQLRAGESVDLAEYAPAEASTGNEIEQVQQAFGVVQHTAVRSAVDEARLRRGISDVFRNLAGRSQSLLHRQLTLLDGMERRATEPDELEDLFRIDHLTTRMRRHAEGLIILSGETPARGWRQPVPLVDVLRAAVAEVEDYTRIRVLCRTSAAVAGHAVADVIHMIAELAENATVFSPPNTPVRIQGDIVGRGFAIEIEDRGLGISTPRLEEINTNLANPPQFDLSGSDRLGLFIAGQLAQRHDIKITLRPSVYGGTTAIVLIPTALVVDADSFERDPALPAGQDDIAVAEGFAGRHAALAQSGSQAGNGFAAGALTSNGGGPAGFGNDALDGGTMGGRGYGGNGAADTGFGNGMADAGFGGHGLADAGFGTSLADAGFGGHGLADTGFGNSLADTGFGNGMADAGFGGTGLADGGRGGAGHDGNAENGPPGDRPAESGYPGGNFADGGPANGGVTGGTLTGNVVSSTSGWSDPSASGQAGASVPSGIFGDNPDHQGSDPGPDYFGRGFSLGGRRPATADPPGGPSHEQPPAAGPAADDDSDSSSRVSSADVTELGLPVRVRQASLAPQLRGSRPPAPAAGTEMGFSRSGFAARGGSQPAPVSPPPGASPAGATPASPEAARNTMSALQRGWQLGRSEAESGPEPPPSVFTPRRSPSGQPASPYEPDAGSIDPDAPEGADDHDGE